MGTANRGLIVADVRVITIFCSSRRESRETSSRLVCGLSWNFVFPHPLRLQERWSVVPGGRAFVTGGRDLSQRKSTTRRRCYRFFFHRYRRYLLISACDTSNREEFMHEERCPVPFTACPYPPYGKVHKFESVMRLGILAARLRVYT